MLTIASDPEHLGAKIDITAVLHTWGAAMTHHPDVHMIVTGGRISPDGSRWIASRPDYLVPVEVLSSLFRGRMLGMLSKVHATGRNLQKTSRWSLGLYHGEIDGAGPTGPTMG